MKKTIWYWYLSSLVLIDNFIVKPHAKSTMEIWSCKKKDSARKTKNEVIKIGKYLMHIGLNHLIIINWKKNKLKLSSSCRLERYLCTFDTILWKWLQFPIAKFHHVTCSSSSHLQSQRPFQIFCFLFIIHISFSIPLNLQCGRQRGCFVKFGRSCLVSLLYIYFTLCKGEVCCQSNYYKWK